MGVRPQLPDCRAAPGAHPRRARGWRLDRRREAAEARELWAAVQREAPRIHAPFDDLWFSVFDTHATAGPTPAVSPSPTPASVSHTLAADNELPPLRHVEDWGEAPDTLNFVGRVEELALLRGWVFQERCRLVAILGMGGIGKTSLAARLAQDVAPSFERVYWRSLRDAPPLSEWLAGAIGFLSDHRRVPPGAEAARLTVLLQLLRDQRCLLVLDNSEALFEPGQREGRYRAGLDGYGRFLLAVGESSHRSCLVLTSREAPPALAVLDARARWLELDGLGLDEGRALLADARLIGDTQAWLSLVDRYGGNGLALKIVGDTIRRLFAGDISAFLGYAVAAHGAVFGGIRQLLEVQAERLSPAERDVLTRLAVEREPVTVAELSRELAHSLGRSTFIEAIETLRRRSLVERGDRAASFTLQSMVLEYVTDRLVETVAEEIKRGHPVLLVEQPLIKAQAKEYVRHTQERLIGTPILQRLRAHHDERGTEQRLLLLLERWRGRPSEEQGYGPGNVVNLLRLLRGDLRGLDLSRLAIRHAYLAEVEAQDAGLVDAHFADTVLAEAFDFPGSVALSRDGALLAAGTSSGQVWLWQVADRRPLWAVQGHTSGVWGVAVSADRQLVASAGGDGMVRLWEISTARPVATLQDHAGGVLGVALPTDGRLLASGGADGTVRVWEVNSGRPVATLQGPTSGVWRLALSADGQLLASGGFDGTVRLWEIGTGRPVATLEGHTGPVYCVALSADGRLVAAGSAEGTVRLWEADSGRLVAAVQGHAGTVCGVAVSGNGQLVASAGGEGTVRLWEADTGRPVATLQGHNGAVRAVALSADGGLLASGGLEGLVRLWETSTGRPLVTLPGQTGMVCSVALSGDGQLVASGGEDRMVRLWEADTGDPAAALEGHSSTVYSVALSADGRLVASAGGEGTVRLWETGTGRPVATLQGHTGMVWSVALSTDGHLVASGGEDTMVCLWEADTGQLVVALQGHTGAVYSVALSADGELLASGGFDGTVRLWEPGTGRLLAALQGHTAPITVVAISRDGRLVVSASDDATVRLWAAPNGLPLATLRGHEVGLWAVALSADGRLLASGSLDGTVKLWEVRRGACLRTLRADRRYERLDITGLTGVTAAQRAALLALGAIEQHAPPSEPAAMPALGRVP